ncbi:MAG: endonuclease domain-containing protein [Patescibacteria group bacterium]|nr:endonuclease domain-containing protein [Patescibacteria group bacterium]MBU2509045.1 endonuclease domain-containing protein [Patescibacteria group bacterium]
MPQLFNDPSFKAKRRFLRKDQTDVEGLLWSRLRSKQIDGLKFYRQFSVGKYILDFYCVKIKLAIELDGGQHSDPLNSQYDKNRTDYLEGKDIKVLRFWNNEVIENLDGVLKSIYFEINKE